MRDDIKRYPVNPLKKIFDQEYEKKPSQSSPGRRQSLNGVGQRHGDGDGK